MPEIEPPPAPKPSLADPKQVWSESAFRPARRGVSIKTTCMAALTA
jgi:hypothetical protein